MQVFHTLLPHLKKEKQKKKQIWWNRFLFQVLWFQISIWLKQSSTWYRLHTKSHAWVKLPRVLVDTVLSGKSFHSLMAFGRNEDCLHWVQHWISGSCCEWPPLWRPAAGSSFDLSALKTGPCNNYKKVSLSFIALGQVACRASVFFYAFLLFNWGLPGQVVSILKQNQRINFP